MRWGKLTDKKNFRILWRTLQFRWAAAPTLSAAYATTINGYTIQQTQTDRQTDRQTDTHHYTHHHSPVTSLQTVTLHTWSHITIHMWSHYSPDK